MNKTLNLLGKPNKPQIFLLVWQGGNSEYCCEFIHDKDYKTAEYSVLQILPKTGINNAVLYKSAVKLNKTNKQHVFRVYVPFAFYNGNKHMLSRVRDCFTAPIEIWRNKTSNWHAGFIKFSHLEWDEMRKAILANFDRVYGRK